MKKIIATFMCLVMSNLYADSIATVLFSVQKAVVNRSGGTVNLARGTGLQVGDTVVTGKGAVVNIKYNNGTLVNLGENSNYKIIAYAPQSKTSQINAQLNKGKMHLKTTGKVKETLKTPVIALAIIGTELKVFVPDKTQVNPLDKPEHTGGVSGNSAKSSPKGEGVYLKVVEGDVIAGNTSVRMGEAVAITEAGITHAPFPATGEVVVPKDAPGAIVSSGVNEVPADNGTSGSSTASTVVALVETAQTASEAVLAANANQSIPQVPPQSLADISLQCF